MSARSDLHVALSLLDQAMDKTHEDFNLTPEELEKVREFRARDMFTAAQRLYNECCPRRTRGVQ